MIQSKWKKGMYVMILDFKCDHDLAIVEDWMRDRPNKFKPVGVGGGRVLALKHGHFGYWELYDLLRYRITSEQALAIAEVTND